MIVRGRAAARTSAMIMTAQPVSNSNSSAMNNWAAASSPSQAPLRAAALLPVPPRPVSKHSATCAISGGSTANCRS
jgi:hypothetical protein